MATTTYFGWTTPDDTSLVKDGAAAIRSLGSAIDASMQDLEGGTSGQTLTKNSNTDMDFVWATASSGGWTTIASGSLPVGSALSITSIPGTYKQLIFMMRNAVNANASINYRFNNDSTSGNYVFGRLEGLNAVGTMDTSIVTTSLAGIANYGADDVANNFFSMLTVNNYESSACDKIFNTQTTYTTNGTNYRIESTFGGYKSATAITRLDVTNTNFTAGTYILYGVK